MTTDDAFVDELAGSVLETLTEWKKAHWHYVIKGNQVGFKCGRTLDGVVRIVSGSAFPNRIMHIELANPQDVDTNRTLDSLARSLYPRAFQLALTRLDGETRADFEETCRRAILHLHSDEEVLVYPLKQEPRVTTTGVGDERSEDTTIGGQDCASVFVAHGRNEEALALIKRMIETLGLQPTEWEDLVERYGSPSPTNLEVVRFALNNLPAYVILLTPDEEVRLNADSRGEGLSLSDNVEYEHQARPNVLIETGMAIAKDLHRTVIVEVGSHRTYSDLDGLNVVRTEKRGWARNFARRLRIAMRNAGCQLDIEQGTLDLLAEQPPFLLRRELADSDEGHGEEHADVRREGEVEEDRFEPDPVGRRDELQRIFTEHGGPTASSWRNKPETPEYAIMKDAEQADGENPLKRGDIVYVQQHYESQYNGHVGAVAKSHRRYHYFVKFGRESGLDVKAFHVMYLSRVRP